MGLGTGLVVPRDSSHAYSAPGNYRVRSGYRYRWLSLALEGRFNIVATFGRQPVTYLIGWDVLRWFRFVSSHGRLRAILDSATRKCLVNSEYNIARPVRHRDPSLQKGRVEAISRRSSTLLPTAARAASR